MIFGYGISPMVPIPLTSNTDLGTGYGKIRLGYLCKISGYNFLACYEKEKNLFLPFVQPREREEMGLVLKKKGVAKGKRRGGRKMMR